MNKKVFNALSTVLCGVVGFTTLTGCFQSNETDKNNNKDAITIMSDELSGLFNPFYATAGADMDVVGMTQIGMLSTDSAGNPVAGDDQPTVVKAFEIDDSSTAETVYTFVLKNGLKFSDGMPLTMNDVMFNIYEYLDPVYTGSSTMYSIDIKGLTKYRMQKNYSSEQEQAKADEALSTNAASRAKYRIQELVDLYEEKGRVGNSTSTSYSMTEAEMQAAISEHSVSYQYQVAVATTAQQATMKDEDYQKILLEDYNLTLKTFKEELESDFKAAKESYDLTTAPYNEWAEQLSNDIFKFFLYEGEITPVYADNQGKKDKTKIVRFEGLTDVSGYTKETAIQKIYKDKTVKELNSVLTGWGTAGTLKTEYTADATDILLHENIQTTDGSLEFPNIEGVVSLGHTTNKTSVTIDGVTYSVAQEHNEDGTPAVDNTYDVLQITVNGQDPKAIYNFGFTVAPAHYYGSVKGDGSDVEIDIANNKFGVKWSDSDFQTEAIKSQLHNKVPVGAGPYKASDINNGDNPTGDQFVSSNVVYYKANANFMFPVKTEKLRMQVVSSTNALDKLENGEVDYVTPQFTKANSERLISMEKSGFKQLSSWQLGYGYIGINAGKVTNVYIRRAIMAAMQTSLACEYYESGTCKTIAWPMSTVSWAYPWEDPDAAEGDKVEKLPTNKSYLQWTGEEAAKKKIQALMNEAGVSANSSELSIKFTIAGASITEHPTYPVFKQAAKILNDLGWNVEVKADSWALTKLATGSLEVWAAAWGSTVDPDMYQVYHMNSSATSVYAWGYREIKNNKNSYEYQTISSLSAIIDDAREIMDQPTRRSLYEDAMELVLDLAVEMPVYQRMTLYAYNSNTIKGLNEKVNPYSSPLEKIWEIELVK